MIFTTTSVAFRYSFGPNPPGKRNRTGGSDGILRKNEPVGTFCQEAFPGTPGMRIIADGQFLKKVADGIKMVIFYTMKPKRIDDTNRKGRWHGMGPVIATIELYKK
jgi:hypothetical protein